MGVLRIIGGARRGMRIATPQGADVRPTPARARESLFNVLGSKVRGARVLDLFAGSGALGFEAASRGAAAVTFVENNSAVFAALKKTAARFAETGGGGNLMPRRGTAQKFLSTPAQSKPTAENYSQKDGQLYTLVFLDPPRGDFARDAAWARLLRALRPHLARHALVYCESDRIVAAGAKWHNVRTGRAAAVFWQLLTAADSPAPPKTKDPPL